MASPSDDPEDWRFDDPPDLGVFVTSDVLRHGAPVVFVSHDDEGDWVFAGPVGFGVDEDEISLVHLVHVVDAHPDLAELADLPRGWEAHRPPGLTAWTRSPEPEAGD